MVEHEGRLIPGGMGKKTFAARLAEGARISYARLKPFRENRVAFLKEYAGSYYGHSAPSAHSPLNLIYQLSSVLIPNIVFQNPKAMVTGRNSSRRADAQVIALRQDKLYDEIDLRLSLRTCALEALFGAGIMKVGVTVPGEEDADGYLGVPGGPFAEPVDLDDYVLDAAARSRYHARFEGNYYTVTKSYLMESGLFDREAARKAADAEGVSAARDQARDLTLGSESRRIHDIFDTEVRLLDLWLPNEGRIVTLPAEGGDVFLRDVPWDGPPRGPYEMLGYAWVPGNAVPVALVGVVFDLAKMINAQARKLKKQADNQKTVVAYDRPAAEDAETVKNAADLDLVGVMNVDRFKTLAFGGVNDKGFQNLGYLLEQFKQIAGNLDLMGGVQAKSPTLGQDELLMQNASIRLDDIRQQIYFFTKRVCEKLAFYQLADPIDTMSLMQKIGGGVEVPVVYDAMEMCPKWDEFEFDIEPYSLSPDSPSLRYRRLMEWLQNVVVPLAPMAVQAGYAIVPEKITEIAGELLNVPYADEIFVKQSPETMGGGPENVTVNVPQAAGPAPARRRVPAAAEVPAPEEKELVKTQA